MSNLLLLFLLQTIDASIHRAYIHLIRGAKRFLYLENQVWQPPKQTCSVVRRSDREFQALGTSSGNMHLLQAAAALVAEPRLMCQAQPDVPPGLAAWPTHMMLLCCPVFAPAVLPGQRTPVGCVSIRRKGHK